MHTNLTKLYNYIFIKYTKVNVIRIGVKLEGKRKPFMFIRAQHIQTFAFTCIEFIYIQINDNLLALPSNDSQGM